MNFVWESWSEFAAMGGYGLYVWGSFGVTALVMGAELLALRRRAKAAAEPADDTPDDDQGDRS